jgi:octaprenyl-diphosphate synthase
MNEAAGKADCAPSPLEKAQRLLGSALPEVEAILQHTIESTVALIPEVSRHLIGSGGKRIRPMLLLLTERACRGAGPAGVPLAVAVELFHSATLLHDDVVDRGQIRRGVPSAPKVFGNSASVLVGDFLFARAFGLVVEHGDLGLLKELSRVLSAMAEGEILQLVRSGRVAVSQPDYLRIISGKTAGLFSWCCRAGASLAAAPGLSEAAARFGQSFGMAFQIMDDVLDYDADPALSGKDLANDLLQGKATLPLLLACEEDPALLALVEQAAARGDPDPQRCREILQRVLATSAIDRARQAARGYADLAVGVLSELPAGPETGCLMALAGFIVDRR